MKTRLPAHLKTHPYVKKYKKIKWIQFATFLGLMAAALLIFGNYPGGKDSVVLVEIFSTATAILFMYHIYRLTQYPMLLESKICEITEEKLSWIRDEERPENNYKGHRYKLSLEQEKETPVYCLQGYVTGEEADFSLEEEVFCISFAGDLYLLKKE